MIRRIEVYNQNEQVFENRNIKDSITDFINLKVTRELNGDWKITFNIPTQNSNSRDNIQIRDIVKCEEQLYRIIQINDKGEDYTAEVIGRHIFFDCKEIHIPDTTIFRGSYEGDIVNTTANEILEEAFDGTKYHILSESEARQLGMELESKRIDFWRMSKTNPCEICEKLLELLGRGQIYINNFNIAIVERIGKDKASKVVLRKDRNISAPSRTIATDNLITRLYVYGENDLTLEDGYIESATGIARYGTIEGYRNYNGIDNPAQLEERAYWEFSAANMYRLDRASISYSFTWYDLSKLGVENESLEVGDIVTIYDADMDILDNLTVISKEHYPLEAESGTIKIGNPVISLGQLLATSKRTTISYSGNIDKYGKIKVKATPGSEFYNEIVEVVKEDVVAADVIEATAAFMEDIFVERLETNIKAIKCLPNIIYDSETKSYKWVGDIHSYIIPPVLNNIRAYIKLEGISLKFIEAHLSESGTVPLQINGKQVYYTSIADAENAYQYFTFVEPKSKYPSMSDDNAEMFKVMIRKSDAEYEKAEFKFDMLNADGVTTFNPKLIIGTGDEAGNGKLIYEKMYDEAMVYIKSRTEEGRERGISIKDDGLYQIRGKERGILPFITISETEPSNPEENDIWIKPM